jgi:hypothetical protein
MGKIDRSKFRPARGIVMYKIYLEMQFREIKDFILEMSASIEDKKKELGIFIDKEIKRSKNDQEAIIDHFMEDIIKYEETYVEILMNSTFISSFSLFESAFIRICKYSKLERGCQLSLSDMRGNGVSLCYDYMKKVIAIDLDSLNEQWNSISKYNKVRNFVVHNSARLINENEKNSKLQKHELFNFMSENPFIEFKNHGKGRFYIKDHQFIIDFCEKAESFLSSIIDKVGEIKKSEN